MFKRKKKPSYYENYPAKKHFLDRVWFFFNFKGLSWKKAWLRILVIIFSFFFGIGLVVLAYVLIQIPSLPDVELLNDYAYELPTILYDKDGKQVFEYYDKKRELIEPNNLPPIVVNALLASEDYRFYDHFGIDVIRIIKAAIVNIAEMDITQGASTITQQTAKLFFLTPERSLSRKVNEALLALKLEHNFTKEEILSFYLNKAFFGRQSYGIEAAAQTYFSKKAADLTNSEAAMIIGLLPAPSRYSPTVNIDAATNRRNSVLSSMAKHEYISLSEKDSLSLEPIVLNLSKKNTNNSVSFFAEEVRRYLVDKYGADKLFSGGLRVYTTMDSQMQQKAQESLEQGLIDIEKRHGYAGPIFRGEPDQTELGNLEERIAANDYEINNKVTGRVLQVEKETAFVDIGNQYEGLLQLEPNNWAVPRAKDFVFNPKAPLQDLRQIINIGDYLELMIVSQPITPTQDATLANISNELLAEQTKQYVEVLLYPSPKNNGAVLTVDFTKGHVLAMVGGHSFGASQFNRTTQSRRQTGSSFKPLVYLAALEKGYTQASILEDTPVVYEDLEEGRSWIPKNYGLSFSGYVTLKDSLVFSKNVPTVKIANDIGISYVIETANRLGIKTDNFPKNLSISLGSASISLWELVRAYSVFPNGGLLVDPIMITKIEDANGKVVEENFPFFYQRVISQEDAFLITQILQEVNERGTGRRSRVLEMVSAGKTGTTNNYSNAWFIGFFPSIITGVYMGNDQPTIPLGQGETGAKAALPVWLNVMQLAKQQETALVFAKPETVEEHLVSSRTGKLICGAGSAYQDSKSVSYFKPGTAPTECDQSIASQNENFQILSDEDFDDPNTSDSSADALNKVEEPVVIDQL